MSHLFHPLLALIASASDNMLARYVAYLKEENRILRDRIPGQIHTRAHERARLLKFGRPLGKEIDELITIVTPGTFRRWIRQEDCTGSKQSTGRPRTNQVLRELVIRIAKETGWGYTKILGELRRLGITRLCRQTVASIVKEEGIEPSPKRKTGTWEEFLKTHTETLWACDFFSVRSATQKGIVDLYLLVFIHVETRRIIVSPATTNPDSAWVTNQANAFIDTLPDDREKNYYLIHDRDAKFSQEFRDTLKEARVKPVKLPVRSPDLNGRCERVIQTIRHECLNHFIVFGKRHLDYLVRVFVGHYNERRAHSARDFLPPACNEPVPENNTIVLEDIVCREELGGLIKTYARRAA
jgi:putative transposase